MRPVSLAEVAGLALLDGACFGMACDEFCDGFYLDFPERRLMQLRLEPVPGSTGHAGHDAWIGAIGEHLARRWQLQVPGWTQRDMHFALRRPVFMPPSRALQSLLIAESPPAFRSRLIFTFAEPLQRARFPAGAEKVRMGWEEAGIAGT